MRKLDDLQLDISILPCAICGSTDFELLATQDRHLLGIHTVGCRICGLLQTNPRPTNESLDHFYAQYYREFYQGVKQPTEAYVEKYNKNNRLRYTVEFLRRSLPLEADTILLDYGCGEGSLFVALREIGFGGDLIGVEPNAAFARYAAESGRATVHASLDSFEKFDIAIINHVLEHLPDPTTLLYTLTSRFKPNGQLYIDVPDAEEYHQVTELHIAHIFHFTERTLKRLVQAAGYKIQLCEKHQPPNHPPSVRLIATPVAMSTLVETNRKTEQFAWKRIRAIERGAWKWVVRKRLNDSKLIRMLYPKVMKILRGYN